MIKPYFKNENNATIVEVEDFGMIRLDKLPIDVRKDEKGHYEIGWVLTYKDGKEEHVLSEYGGKSSFDFGGRNLGVIREIE
jgi:ribosomal protein S6